MTRLPSPLRGLILALLVGPIPAAPLTAAPAADVPESERGLLPAEPLKTEDVNLLGDCRDGKITADEAERASKHGPNLLDRAARHFAYRLTQPIYSQGIDPTKDSAPFTMNQLVEQAFRSFNPQDPKKYLSTPRTAIDRQRKDRQDRFMRDYSAALIVHLRKVLKNNELIARVNAARILARLGECGRPEAADSLLDLLADPEQKDGLKFYALQGLRGYLEITRVDPPGEDAVETKKRDTRIAAALINFAKRPSELPPTASRKQVEAFQYVRREAVRGIGLLKTAVINDPGTKQDLYPALVLAQFVRKEGISPEPTLSEQVEAAIGLCHLQRGQSKYQPEVAAFHVSWFVIEFLRLKGEPAGQTFRPEPWKYDAARLAQGLDLIKAEFNSPAAKKVAPMVDRCRDLLKEVEANKQTAADPSVLLDQLNNAKPDNMQIIEGQETTTLKSAG